LYKEKKYINAVTIIGGIMADIEGRPDSRLIYADSNPGTISIAYGGVGRNIAENLARYGSEVGFFSIVGDDLIGKASVKELEDAGVDVSGVKFLVGQNTAMYISILDIMGDMELGLCNMDTLEKVSSEFIDEVAEKSSCSKVIALDTNLTEDTLGYAVERLGDKALFLDPVSTVKAARAKDLIGKFHMIKPNRAEAEVLLDMEIRDPRALVKAGKAFIEKGVTKVFISLSAGGVYYTDGKNSGLLKSVGKIGKNGSATGAGDAFSAGIIFGYINGYEIRETAKFSLISAYLTMKSKSAVNPDISYGKIAGLMDELQLDYSIIE
jgi:pseudouridine kinase